MAQQVALHDCHQQKLPPGVVGKSRPTLDRCQEVPSSERPQPHLWVSQGGPASDPLGVGLGSHIWGTVVSPDSWPVKWMKHGTS